MSPFSLWNNVLKGYLNKYIFEGPNCIRWALKASIWNIAWNIPWLVRQNITKQKFWNLRPRPYAVSVYNDAPYSTVDAKL